MAIDRSSLYNVIKNKLINTCNLKGYNLVLDYHGNSLMQDKQAILLPTREAMGLTNFNQNRFIFTYEVMIIRFLRDESMLYDIFGFIEEFLTRLNEDDVLYQVKHKVEYTYGNFGTSNEMTMVAKIILDIE